VNYEFHVAAEAEHLETVAYYESKRPGLGATYWAEFELAMERILEMPRSYPIEMEPDIRHRVMKKFPFTIIFRETPNLIQVLAIAHHRRRPAYWLGRL
jgi:toxin ParE1/3/4